MSWNEKDGKEEPESNDDFGEDVTKSNINPKPKSETVLIHLFFVRSALTRYI